jgi:hypothetical protein
MPGKKMTVTKSTTTTKKGGPGVKVAPKGTTMGTAQRTEAKKATPVNSTTRAKYTDTQKKAAAIKGGPGVKVAPKGTTMGTAQRTEAKKKVDAFYQRNGVWPTPENVKKGYK